MQTNADGDRSDLLTLAWLWCQRGKPAKAAKLAKDVAPLLPEGTAAAAVDASLARLTAAGLIEKIPPKKTGAPDFKTTPAGERRAADQLRRADLPPDKTPWKALVNIDLPALALDLPAPPDKKAQPAFTKLLPLATCAREHALDLPLDRGFDAAKLALVKLALARSHGLPPEKIYLKKLPPGELPALVAGPLLGAAGTAAAKLDKLIEARAFEILRVSKSTALRPAIVRWWVAQQGGRPRTDLHLAGPLAGRDSDPETAPEDPLTFAQRALAAARDVARAGAAGLSNLGDKVLVHYVWRRYQELHGPIPLDQFKRQASAANGDGLVLVCEDLIPDDRRPEFEQSEVRTGASRYHYVRI